MSISISLTTSIAMTQAGTTRLEVTAIGANITGKIFAIETLPSSSDSENPNVRFSHVCSPMELYEFPEDESLDGSVYFRVDSISMVFDVPIQAEQVLETLRGKVERLVYEMNALESTGISIGSLSVPDVISIMSAPPEFQFSVDGEDWHDEQTDNDAYIRMRNSALKGDWSDKVKMPVRQ